MSSDQIALHRERLLDTKITQSRPSKTLTDRAMSTKALRGLKASAHVNGAEHQMESVVGEIDLHAASRSSSMARMAKRSASTHSQCMAEPPGNWSTTCCALMAAAGLRVRATACSLRACT